MASGTTCSVPEMTLSKRSSGTNLRRKTNSVKPFTNIRKPLGRVLLRFRLRSINGVVVKGFANKMHDLRNRKRSQYQLLGKKATLRQTYDLAPSAKARSQFFFLPREM